MERLKVYRWPTTRKGTGHLFGANPLNCLMAEFDSSRWEGRWQQAKGKNQPAAGRRQRAGGKQAEGSGQVTGKKAFGRIRLGGFDCSAVRRAWRSGQGARTSRQLAGGSWQLAAGRTEYRIANLDCGVRMMKYRMTLKLEQRQRILAYSRGRRRNSRCASS